MYLQVYFESVRVGQPHGAWAIVVTMVVSLAAGSAVAQEGSEGASQGSLTDASREAARALGREALVLFDRGDYAAALTRFEQAYAVYPAPTLGLHAARCLERLGRLASAADAYRRVTERPLDVDAAPAFREAHAQAARELGELLPRVPRLAVRVDGASAREGATLTIDDKLQQRLSVELPIDPGVHHVEARLGSEVVRRELRVAEGRREHVALLLSPARMSPPPARGAAPGGSPLRALGLVAVGTGAVGLVAWGVAGASAVAQRGDLDDRGCRDVKCPAELQEDVDAYNTARVLSTVGFVVGAVGVTAGIALLIAAPSHAPSRRALTPWIGPGSGGLRGSF